MVTLAKGRIQTLNLDRGTLLVPAFDWSKDVSPVTKLEGGDDLLREMRKNIAFPYRPVADGTTRD